MKLRKINGYLTLPTTAVFVIHTSVMCLCLMGIVPYQPGYKIGGFLLLVLCVAHALLSVVTLLANTKDTNNGKVYCSNKKIIMLQRISGFLMLFMTIVHVQNGMQLWGYQIAYIAVTSAHIALSLPGALVTVGAVGSEKSYKKFQIFAAVLCIALTIWSAVSYAMMGS